MFNLSYDDIISRIKEEKQISDEEIQQRIREKLTKLSDLISKDGAAHIVAHELGVKIINIPKEVKINQLLTGMTNVTLTGKVVKLNDTIQFNKNGRSGKVSSFLFGDETGTARAVFWDTNHINEIENGNIKEGRVLKIKNCYVKSNNGYKEIHLANRSELEIISNGVNIEVSDNISYDFEKKRISELKEGDNGIGVFGTIVQVFEPRFYEACKQCGKKLEVVGEDAMCKEHGRVVQELLPVVNVFIDDGTGNVRAVAFRNNAEGLLGINKEKMLELRDKPEEFDRIRSELLGKQVLIIGKVTKNEMFGNHEMTIQRIIELKPEELIKELAQVS